MRVRNTINKKVIPETNLPTICMDEVTISLGMTFFLFAPEIIDSFQCFLYESFVMRLKNLLLKYVPPAVLVIDENH